MKRIEHEAQTLNPQGDRSVGANERKRKWDNALNICSIDGFVPDAEFKQLVQKHIDGAISNDELISAILLDY